jgi:UDP-N-acetylmuramate dehydrogenase
MNWREIECLAGIPRSTGATPIQNVGAYGQQVAEVIVSARARDHQAKEVVELTGTECEIAYGSSTFRGSARHVALGVAFVLERCSLGRPVRYPEFARAVGVKPEGAARRLPRCARRYLTVGVRRTMMPLWPIL